MKQLEVGDWIRYRTVFRKKELELVDEVTAIYENIAVRVTGYNCPVADILEVRPRPSDTFTFPSK